MKGCGEAKNGFRNQARNTSLKALGTDLVLRFPADNAAGKWVCYTITVYDTQKPSSCSEGQLFLVPDGKFLPGASCDKASPRHLSTFSQHGPRAAAYKTLHMGRGRHSQVQGYEISSRAVGVMDSPGTLTWA